MWALAVMYVISLAIVVREFYVAPTIQSTEVIMREREDDGVPPDDLIADKYYRVRLPGDRYLTARFVRLYSKKILCRNRLFLEFVLPPGDWAGVRLHMQAAKTRVTIPETSPPR